MGDRTLRRPEGRLKQQESYGESNEKADPTNGRKRNHKLETACLPYTAEGSVDATVRRAELVRCRGGRATSRASGRDGAQRGRSLPAACQLPHQAFGERPMRPTAERRRHWLRLWARRGLSDATNAAPAYERTPRQPGRRAGRMSQCVSGRNRRPGKATEMCRIRAVFVRHAARRSKQFAGFQRVRRALRPPVYNGRVVGIAVPAEE
jgi:hypothetical protein